MHQHLSRFICRMEAISIHKAKHQQLINNKQYEELFRYSEHNVTVTETLSSKIHSPQVLYKSLEQFLHRAMQWAMSSIISRIFVGIICIIKIIKHYKNIRTLSSVDPLSKHLIPKQCKQIHVGSIILTYSIAIVATATTQISAERKI